MKNDITKVTEQKIQELDKSYVLIWSKMQDFPKGSPKHRELTAEFLKISAELVKLKHSLTK